MFSNRLLKFLRLLLRVSRFFGVIAGNFNTKSNQFQADTDIEWKVRLNWNLFFIWIIASFGIAIKYLILKDLDRVYVTLVYLFPGVLIFIQYSVFRWFLHDICIMFNGFSNFIRYMHRNYYPSFNPDACKENYYFDRLLHVSVHFLIFCYTLLVMVLVYDSRGTVFLGDFVPLKYYSFSVQLLIILYHAYVLLVIHLAGLVVTTATLTYGFYFLPILIRELRLGRRNYRMKCKLRRPQNIQRVFRCLHILHANVFGGILGLLIAICDGMFVIIIVFCNFVLIKYWERLQVISKLQFLAWAGIFTGFWVCVLQIGLFLFVRGSRALASWKGDWWRSKYERKIMMKFLKSCKPLLLGYGKQFVIARVSVLIFFKGIVRGTFRVLLTTSENM